MGVSRRQGARVSKMVLDTLGPYPREPCRSNEILVAAFETMPHIINSFLRPLRPCRYHQILASRDIIKSLLPHWNLARIIKSLLTLPKPYKSEESLDTKRIFDIVRHLCFHDAFLEETQIGTCLHDDFLEETLMGTYAFMMFVLKKP